MAAKFVELLKQRAALPAGTVPPIVVRTLLDMHALRDAADIVSLASNGRLARVGFVPTMGALHSGHVALMAAARAGPDAHRAGHAVALAAVRGAPASPATEGGGRADMTVASIFVNPTQFAPSEDLSSYPRTWEADLAALTAAGADAVFAPTPSAMYPPFAPASTFVSHAGVDANTPEGAARPGFFTGVATVVTKLLSIVRPSDAYFGQKDGVQCIVVRSLARDLSLSSATHVCATVREADGLAKSSRNVYLSAAHRALAPAIYSALSSVQAGLAKAGSGTAGMGHMLAQAAPALSAADAEKAAQQAAVAFARAASAPPPVVAPLARELAEAAAYVRGALPSSAGWGEVQYVTFSDAATGRPVSTLDASTARNGAVLLSMAVRIGSTRLLDNIVLRGTPDDLGVPKGSG
jgi:pantoate--beta-alanine ligase